MFETLAAILDWFGIIVFTASGALVASRKEMDAVGFILLGTATGIGGGSIRDILLGELPVFWVTEPAYLLTCILVSLGAFFVAGRTASRYQAILWFDAVGLALFAVAGAEKAMIAEVGPLVAISMGVVTATFGGIVRDILGGESPVILRQEIYATAALLGAVLFVALTSFGLSREIGLSAGFLVALAVRFAAIRWNWSLPRYRPGRPSQ